MGPPRTSTIDLEAVELVGKLANETTYNCWTFNGKVPGPFLRDALRHVIDPEIGINVVDLGLVYEAKAKDGDVRVVMTMTTPACPLDESIAEDARAAIRQTVRGVKSVAVDLVLEPPWQPSMMSSASRERLGWT